MPAFLFCGPADDPAVLIQRPIRLEAAIDRNVLTKMSDTTPAVYSITLDFDGEQHQFQCRDNQTILSAAEDAGITLPSSCCAGVCTTCAARVQEGEVCQPDAMGVKEELRKDGFALLCVASPRSDLMVLAGQEDALYQAQFGQYQK